jgi:hypothetical protein
VARYPRAHDRSASASNRAAPSRNLRNLYVWVFCTAESARMNFLHYGVDSGMTRMLF